MRYSNIIKVIFISALLTSIFATAAWSSEPALPDYLENANSMVANAATAGSNFQELADDIIIAKNFVKNANTEYSKNLGSFSGKLDEKAVPAVRHLASMASLQATLVIAKANSRKHEIEIAKTISTSQELRSKIKVFDDLSLNIKQLKTKSEEQAAKITLLEAKMASLNAELAAKGSAITSSDQKTSDLLKALDEQKKATSSSEQRVALLTQELEGLKKQTVQLQATGEQLAADNRLKAFEAEAGRLGGITKSTAAGLTVTFPRSQMLKVTGKSTTLTPVGDGTVTKLAGLINTYPEYRLKLRVHGFGQPTRSEDAAATDQMARFVRESILTKGKFEPATVEALGVGSAEPAFPKNNIEGNRRLEIIFVKK